MSTENFKNNVASYHVTCPVSNGGPTFVLFCLWVGLNKKKFKFIQFIWKWLNFILLNVNVWFTKSFIQKSNRKILNREKVAGAHDDDRVYIRASSTFTFLKGFSKLKFPKMEMIIAFSIICTLLLGFWIWCVDGWYSKPQKSAVRAIPYPVKRSFPWCQHSVINPPIQKFVPGSGYDFILFKNFIKKILTSCAYGYDFL